MASTEATSNCGWLQDRSCVTARARPAATRARNQLAVGSNHPVEPDSLFNGVWPAAFFYHYFLLRACA
ncbi:MAG: hypothetical protein M3466_12990, partial [Gemmatimonadota bacterium]|nr:hypothetical protein [Gemmatimonadota bacterium]